LKKLNLSLFDPGYMNTSVAKSKITFIDGDKGILEYRGYNIEDLASRATFEEGNINI
jgi:citrate synthase